MPAQIATVDDLIALRADICADIRGMLEGATVIPAPEWISVKEYMRRATKCSQGGEGAGPMTPDEIKQRLAAAGLRVRPLIFETHDNGTDYAPSVFGGLYAKWDGYFRDPLGKSHGCVYGLEEAGANEHNERRIYEALMEDEG